MWLIFKTRSTRIQISFDFKVEIDDLWKLPIEESPAYFLAYSKATFDPRTSYHLPVGTQSRFIKAAAIAADLGRALNTMLTIRWDSLLINNDPNELRVLPNSPTN